MLKELLKPEIQELIESHNWNDLKVVLSSWPAPEISDLLLDIDKRDKVLLFRSLPKEISTDVFSYLEHEEQDELIRQFTDQETKELLADMSPDDRTSFLEELPARVTKRLFDLLSPEDLKEARELLGYPEESIGRLMTPDFVAVRPDWSIKKSLEHIRQFGKDSETINRIYVTDTKGKLLDDILLRYIILAKETQIIDELLDYNVVSVSANDDQEDAVRTMEKYDISALPVVNSEGELVGIVTFDDIMDISKEEVTEDFQKISAISPFDASYSNASVWHLWAKRIPWLFFLLIANFLTTGVISFFSNELQAIIALAFFIPMLTDTGGNTGTQSATLVIRGLSTGDIELKDWARVISKELVVGIFLGIVLAGVAYFRGLLIGDDGTQIAIVISSAMLLLVIWSNLIGTILPLLLYKLKLDPAVVSSPFITTFVDVTGLLIYFNIARLVLDL
ncbi:MAG: magnesium transporter [Ignavibacteria bacterium]|jgi:magnesium transporter|nr:magnesium transporter [Ignavibacteria bacterium]